MAGQIEPPVGPPLGFPKCPRRTYRHSGPPRVCLAYSRRSFEDVAATACTASSQIVEGTTCPNWLCTDPNRHVTI